MKIKAVADEILKEAGFEKHLQQSMETLNFLQNEWELEKKKNQNVLKVHGYNKRNYDQLIKDLESDFNAIYSPQFKGLIFKEVKNLFKHTRLRYRVNDVVKLEEDIDDTRGRTLGEKGEKVKILKVYTPEESGHSGDDYVVQSISDNKIFDVPHFSLYLN